MKNDMYRPSGQLQGDDSAMPNKGSTTGMAGAQTYGASVQPGATNSGPGIHRATLSDAMNETDANDKAADGDE